MGGADNGSGCGYTILLPLMLYRSIDDKDLCFTLARLQTDELGVLCVIWNSSHFRAALVLYGTSLDSHSFQEPPLTDFV